MLIKDCKKGMRVRISLGECQKSVDYCGVNSIMEKLKGTIVKILSIHDESVTVDGGWSWHVDDVIDVTSIIIQKKKVKKTEFFDEQRIWI